jgi:hypothetical protein
MSTSLPIGWVLRASTVGFTIGCRILQPNVPQFGDLVKVPLPDDGTNIFGLKDGGITQGLPPRPPLSLDMLIMCDENDLRGFASRLDYLRLVLNAAQIPADEVLITNLQRTAAAHPPETRRAFLIGAGRELARLLNADLVRLDSILRRIRPE